MSSLSHIARQLGGDIAGRNAIVCPGPGHSPRDRSLSVKFDGEDFQVFSHSGDDWRTCRDHIHRLLGGKAPAFEARSSRVQTDRSAGDRALTLWNEAVTIGGTLAETYLRQRGFINLTWFSDVRFHARCPFGDSRLPCMVALYRDILSNEPRAIHRTALAADGKKIGRKVLGQKRGCAIKLSDDADVELGLTIGEGIETALAAAAECFKPVWALGDANGIASFPVLSGVECLTVAVDNDPAGHEAARKCSDRWIAAGKEVLRVIPWRDGADMADVVGRSA